MRYVFISEKSIIFIFLILDECCSQIVIRVDDSEVLRGTTADLRDIWEETSFQLERFQSNPECVEAEQSGLRARKAPRYHLTFDPAEMFSRTVVTNEGRISNRDRSNVCYSTIA